MPRAAHWISCIAGVLLTLLYPVAASADHPDPLPNSFLTDTLGYAVGYTSENPYNCSADPLAGDDGNFVADEIALDMADALDSGGSGSPGNPPGYHIGYTNLGFHAPDFDGNEPPPLAPFVYQVQIYDCAPDGVHDDDDCDNGSASASLIRMPATRYCNQSELSVRRVIGHELFHHVQFAYIDFDNWSEWGKTPVEGTARMMEDHVFSDIDANSDSRFLGQVTTYLDDPNRVWLDSSYSGALGWKYAAERFGTTTVEPQFGVDFVRRFWERAEQATEDGAIDFPDTFERTMRETSPGMTLEEWFADFSIANIAKEFDTSLLPDGELYQYVDESDGNGTTFSAVARVSTSTIPNGVSDTTELARWGAAYVEAELGPDCAQRSVFGISTVGDYKGYAVLAVDGANKVRQLVRGAGENNAVSFIQRAGADAYTKFFGVLIGRDDDAVVDWQLDCGTAGIQIRRPDQQFQAFVGPPTEPRTFIVRTVVTGPTTLGDPTVLGLQPDDFTVFVGTNNIAADEATVLSGLYVQGEYWLVVQAPAKTNTNTYAVFVNYGSSVFHSQANAVSYEERLFDQVLTLDTSGSMTFPVESPSIEAAVNAASLFVDVARPDDTIGLVTFAGNNIEPDLDSIVREALDDADDGQRDAIQADLGLITPTGQTSIGDGLSVAAGQFPLGSPLGEDWIVLLSDGMENEALFWTNVESSIKSAGIRVNSIALGPDADQILLQEIATETDGDFYYVDTGTLVEAAAGGSLPNRLADVYAASSERIKAQERLWEFSGSAGVGQSQTHQFLVQEGGIVEATISANWDDPADAIAVTITRPDGSIVTNGVGGARIYVANTHVIAHVGDVMQGTWTVKVTGSAGTTDYIGALAGRDKQGASLRIFFTQFQDNLGAQAVGARFLRGLEQPIMALLVDRDGIVTGASVRADVEHPDGTSIDLPLFDDGAHGDGNAGDGVYGNVYARTTMATEPDLPDQPGVGRRGSYNVVVHAEGTDSQGQAFTRIRKGSFSIYEPRDPPPDADGDRVPTTYEDLHRCLDSATPDADADGDEDRLLNRDEWGVFGTDPCNADTDRGGESDSSEVGRGANPFDPEDDALPRPIDVEVIASRAEHLPFPDGGGLKPRANWIRYPVNSAYARIHVLRSLSPNGPFSEIADLDPQVQSNLYYDAGLSPGQTYYYKIEPEDLNGNLGAPSPVFSGTAKDEPVPPIGDVMINNGQSTTNSTAATLRVNANADTTSMQRSNDVAFTGAVWQPYAILSNWTLVPDPATAVAIVYVRFRDAALNVSATYEDTIQVLAPSQTGRIVGTALLEGALEHDGILVKVPGQGDVSPAYTTTAGKFAFNALLPGSYDLKLSRTGYLPETLTGLIVTAGGTTNAGTTTLAVIDTDADAIPDFEDNCTLLANPDQRNTDGDAYGNRCDPDLDNNGSVNFADLGLFKAVFFSSDPDADFDGDGSVNFSDLGILKAFFFMPPGPAGVLP